MTFPQRGLMLKALALYLQERKEAYYCRFRGDRGHPRGQLD